MRSSSGGRGSSARWRGCGAWWGDGKRAAGGAPEECARDPRGEYDGAMGQRGRTESVTAVMAALFTRKSWQQAELARQVGLSTEALRKLLREMVASGIEVEQSVEHPHVYWKRPKTWFPGGVLFKEELVPDLLRQLRRLSRSKVRERLLAVIAEQLPVRAKLAAAPPVVTRTSSEQEETYVPIIEDSAARKIPLFMKYLTTSRGKISDRHASVHLVDPGPPARFIATCHRNDDLRWFRVDSLVSGRVDDRERFRDHDAAAVSAFRAASLDGYKGEGAPIACSFFVRDPEARWVCNNLLEGMQVETLHDGIRVRIETSAVLRLARFVVGFGAAAKPETSVLAETVIDLARGALEQATMGSTTSEAEVIPVATQGGAVRPRSDV